MSDSADHPADSGSPPVTGSALIHTAVLAGVWASLLFAMQEYTTGPNYPLPVIKSIGSRFLRLMLDVSACGAAAFLLSGRLIYPVLVFGAVPPMVLIVYYEYFGKALSWTTMANHLDEGLAIGDFAAELVRWPVLLFVTLGSALLVILARRAHRRPVAHGRRLRVAGICAAGYLLVALVSTQSIDPLRKLKTFATVDRLAMTHGYVLTWLGEWWHLDGDALLARAMEAARIEQNRLTSLEAAVPLGERVVIVQVESLDDSVVDLDVDGRAVMPFLRELSKRSMRYRITAIHRSGSCDSDFTMLMNLNPAGDVTPYAVPGFDWRPSIAELAGRAGRRSVFIHGNDRSFFGRGPVIDQMGFDTVLFRDELIAQFGVAARQWGVSDGDVLTISRRLLTDQSDPVLHFIITLTSHGPYHFVDPAEWELFPQASNGREHYLNSMRYVDTQLRRYVESLPDETVVVLYGDHTSHVSYGQEPVRHGREFVPFMIHRAGSNLATIQRTRDQAIAVSGELTTLDAAGYVWSLLANEIVP